MTVENLARPNFKNKLLKKIYIKQKALDIDHCNQLIDFGSKNVNVGLNKHPNSFNVSFHSCTLPLNSDTHKMLNDVWVDVIKFLDFDIDFIEPYELKRYTSEDFFEKHTDTYNHIADNVDRKITMSVQLSDENEYEDGSFNVLNHKFKLPKGSIIAFPSFFEHEVEKIQSGVRWSLIGWGWGPYWR
jgi:hypothetical protein